MLAFVMLFAVAMNVAGCGDNSGNSSDTATVTWYDGRKELKSEEVTKGSKVTEWTPEKDGSEFFGWYADAAYGSAFNFDEPIEEDTDIFARFRSATPDEDNRMWYVIGSVAGENWDFLTELNDDGEWVKSARGQVASNQKYFFTNEGNNVFSVTLTLRPNCKFQFVTNLTDPATWDGDEGKGRMGLGNLKGFEYAEGINPEADGGLDGYHALEDKMYGEVKDENGNVVFNGGQGYDVATYCWNIYPATGSDGVYEFKFKSYPGDEAINVVEWKCIEKLEPLESFYDMYLTGSYHNSADDVNPSTNTGPADVWDDDPEADWCVHFTKVEGTTIHRAFITITEDMYPTWSATENPAGVSAVAFKAKNLIDGNDYGCGGSSGVPGSANCWITAGTWCITFDEATSAVSWEKCDYYVIGTFMAGTRYYNFTVADPIVTPTMTSSDNGKTYTATVNVPDVAVAEPYNWLWDHNAVFAVEVAHGCELGVMETFGVHAEASETAEENYLYFETVGTYKVTYDVESGTISSEKINNNYYDLELVTVTYYDVQASGPVQIEQEELLKGQAATYKPEGRLKYIFDCWYEDAACTTKANTALIQSDISLYGKYVEGFEPDTRDFYVVGQGVSGGTLGNRGANFTSLNEQLKLTRQSEPDADGYTVYSIDMLIYTGDVFKIVLDLSWRGGTHFGYGQMRDPDSRFNGSGVGNIVLKTGNSGRYTIKFHSNPYNSADSYIEYTFNSSVEEKDVFNMYITGIFEATLWHGWSQNQNNMLKMTREADGATWSVTAHFTGGDEFKVFNLNTGAYYPDGTDDQLYIGSKSDADGQFEKDENGVIAGSGYYKITWNQDDQAVLVEQVTLDEDPGYGNAAGNSDRGVYLIGNFKANGHDTKWSTKSTDKLQKMTRDACGYTWSVTLDFDANDMFKVYLYLTGSDGTWVPHGRDGGETKITEAGTYTVTWNHFTNAITVTKAQPATASIAAQVLELLSTAPLYYTRRYSV